MRKYGIILGGITLLLLIFGQPIQVESSEQVLLDSSNSAYRYYGMYSEHHVAASFTLTNTTYISSIEVILRTAIDAVIADFNFTVQDSLENPTTVYVDDSFAVPIGMNQYVKIIDINQMFNAGTYYLLGIMPDYFGTDVTAGDVNGWYHSNGVYIESAGQIEDGLWSNNGGEWYFLTGDYFDTGTIYHAPCFRVNGYLLDETNPNSLILTQDSPDVTVSSGESVTIYGTSNVNLVTIESGANAELVNFPGGNMINIVASPEGFSVYRSGATVTFQGSDGTLLKIPATETPQIINFTDRPSLTLSIYQGQVMLDDQVVTASPTSIEDNQNAPDTCGAYVAPGVWKEFDCYNLAAIGKTTNDDPFTPSWRLIGGYWQWGRKGPDESQWYDTNTEHFAHGPTGPDAEEANEGEISNWDGSYAPDGAWSDSEKTANDPCPAGYRVPSVSQWEGVLDNNTQSTVGTWNFDDTNYSSARFFGDALMLPAAGYRYYGHGGALGIRGFYGAYWSSSEDTGSASYLTFTSNGAGAHGGDHGRLDGFSVRCVAE